MDMIDRQAAIDAIETVGYDFSESDLSEVELEEVCEAVGYTRQDMIARIKRLPSAEPQERKTGEWILTKKHRLVDETDDGGIYDDENYWYCSNCGHGQYMYSKPNDNFCPNCGARMK